MLVASLVIVAAGCDGYISVRGHVYGPDGVPLKGAEASLLGSSGKPRGYPQVTDARGCFAIRTTAAPGRSAYRLEIRKDGYEPAPATAFSGSRKVNEVEVHMTSLESTSDSESRSWERDPKGPPAFDAACER
jgi:hypothetical protein